MAETVDSQYPKVRSFLNRVIRGPNTTAILKGITAGCAVPLANLIPAVQQQFRISTANGNYLDTLLSEYGIVRPSIIGISDDTFRAIGIASINAKQIRSLLLSILNISYGDLATKSNTQSGAYAPYNLTNATVLNLQFDGGTPVSVNFTSNEFSSIAAATAQEVADAISKSLSTQGVNGVAFTNTDSYGNEYVVIMSSTIGASSSVTVLGGDAQNVLFFSLKRATTATAATVWSVSQNPINSQLVRYTVNSGSIGTINDPNLGFVEVGDYANIYSSGFSAINQGTFTIVDVGYNYFDVENEAYNQRTDSQINLTQGNVNTFFFSPEKNGLTSQYVYACVFQTSPRSLQVYMPAITNLIYRNRIGGAFLNLDSSDSAPAAELGPYIYDPTQNFEISQYSTTLSAALTNNTGRLVSVTNASSFPSVGSVVLNYGHANQEVVAYVAIPSSDKILLAPTYKLKYSHASGEDICYLNSTAPVNLASNGSDYQFYLSDVVLARGYVQSIMQDVLATGIDINFTILYPNSTGLALWGTLNDSKVSVWGGS
jgi:hypothetical protein